MLTWLLAEQGGQPTISAADWIIIGLTAATLLVATVGTMIAWWVLLKPATHLVIGDAEAFEVVCIVGGGSVRVSGAAFAASMGSFMIIEDECRVLSGGFLLPFLSSRPFGAVVTEVPQMAHGRRQVYGGGTPLNLMYNTAFSKIAPDTKHVVLDIRIKAQGERPARKRVKVPVRWETPPDFGTADSSSK